MQDIIVVIIVVLGNKIVGVNDFLLTCFVYSCECVDKWTQCRKLRQAFCIQVQAVEFGELEVEEGKSFGTRTSASWTLDSSIASSRTKKKQWTEPLGFIMRYGRFYLPGSDPSGYIVVSASIVLTIRTLWKIIRLRKYCSE